MEIISCRPVISRTDRNGHIGEWIKWMMDQGDINGIVDPRLNGKYDVDSVRKAVEIAVKCVSEDSARRPTMRKVVAGLKKTLAMELKNQASNPTNSLSTMSITDDSESYIQWQGEFSANSIKSFIDDVSIIEDPTLKILVETQQYISYRGHPIHCQLV